MLLLRPCTLDPAQERAVGLDEERVGQVARAQALDLEIGKVSNSMSAQLHQHLKLLGESISEAESEEQRVQVREATSAACTHAMRHLHTCRTARASPTHPPPCMHARSGRGREAEGAAAGA